MSFFNDLLGKTSANAAKQLGERNMGRTNSGYDAADSAATTGYNQSMDIYRPYAEGGRRGQTAYENTLGLNGADARQKQFTEGYVNDPALAYRNQNNTNQMNALYRKYNAGPQGVNSGAAMMGAGRLASEQFNNDWGGYQNRLMNMGQQGYNAAGQMANMTTGYYGGVGDRSIGRQNALNGIDQQSTQAQNDARMAGVNNLLKIGGGAAQLAMGGMGGGFGNAGAYAQNALGGGYFNPGQSWMNPDTGRRQA